MVYQIMLGCKAYEGNAAFKYSTLKAKSTVDKLENYLFFYRK